MAHPTSWSRVADDDAHRPWPRPSGAWALRMTWRDLLFAHWRLAPALVEPHLPDGLELDLFDGEAYLGVVPFLMDHTSARGLPDLPGLSTLPELNVRTYVVAEDKPGVFFFSLDAANPLAVWGARTFFHLPYRRARMRCLRRGDEVTYRSERTDPRGPAARFSARYRPAGPARQPRAGLEQFLVERYCLYAAAPSGLRRTEINHSPWPLQDATWDLEEDSMTAGLFERSGTPLLHFADRQDVVAWWPESV